MSLPTIEPLPDEDASLPPARRRRQRRMLVPPGSSDRAAFLDELARRTVPSIDFFLYSLLSGLMIGAALVFDAPALVFLAALLAPFLAPAVGISLGTITGAAGFVARSLSSLAIGSLIVFLCGVLAGWAAGWLPNQDFEQARFLTQFNWASFLVLILGAGLTSYLAVHSPEQNPLVPSAALAYGLFLPAGAAGFSLTRGIAGGWPGGLFLFLIHLIWAILIGTLVLWIFGIRPLNSRGYTLSGLYAVVGVAALVFLSPPWLSPVTLAPSSPLLASPAPVSGVGAAVTETPTAPPASPTTEPTATRRPTLTATPTQPVPTPTPSLTITPTSTPVMAVINSSEGARMREEPNYDAETVQILSNGFKVEILGEPVNTGGVIWLHVRAETGKEGWIIQPLIRTVTPPSE